MSVPVMTERATRRTTKVVCQRPTTQGRKRERDGGEEEDVQVDQEDVGETNTISEYELQRLERIKRNNAFMASLSLGSPNKAPSTQSTKRRPPAKRQRSPKPRTAPSRTSRRLKGESVDPDDLVALPGTWIGSLATATSKPGTAPPPFRHDYGPELNAEEAEKRMEVLKEQIDERDDAKAGTASYQHCLYRVRTMSDAQLARRVRTIERARGAKAKEKMLVFSNVLRARGKTDLLEMAEAALDRLVRGVPMP
eukprot:g13223.t1